MGVYNPQAPRVLGQEWVDIREEDVTFSPSINFQELGHTFTPTANRTITQGGFYISAPPPAMVSGQVMMMQVYKTGTEAISGPVQTVLIPCNAGTITGTGMLGPNGALAAADIPLIMEQSGDGNFLTAQPDVNTGSKQIGLYFATNNYSQLLMGKRILKVELVHGLSWDPINSGTTTVSSNPPVFDTIAQGFGIGTTGDPAGITQARYAPFVSYYGAALNALDPPTGNPSQALPTLVTSFGEINLFGPGATRPTADWYPWRYQDLQRFEVTAGSSRLAVVYEFGASTTWVGVYYLGYAALKVYFCEENRVMYGARTYGQQLLSGLGDTSYIPGANKITLRDTGFNTNPVLLAGQQYTVTVSSPDLGNLQGSVTSTESQSANSNTYPTLNGLREIDSNPVNTGVKVNLTQEPGETFTKETTHILPQLSLHTSGGPLVEVHAYGRQARGQVYGTLTVTQEILDSAAGGATTWPWVRFYARRFGNTTIPLTLTGASQSVSISVADFDALDEVLDGWKKVDLRYTTPPTMGAGTNPQFIWSAAGELPGNRWEILGAIAPALSGIPGNLLNLVPSPNQLSSATYGQPSAGATINMGWVPGYAPLVSATTDDQTADAVVIFSQDMPTVTGFAVTGTSMALTGIGLNCNAYPWYIPSSLTYNRLTWVATSSSTPTSGFGYYEIQRMDTLTDWQTIAHMTSPAASGFNDYEARVSLLTSYRIRSVNASLFPGQWSSTVTITTAAPGVSGTGMSSSSHTMMFTSNQNQNGSRVLAYANAYANDTTEEFSFPEAGFNKFQLMYNRDYQVAYRPTERGGSVFSRTVLVQAAAISPPTLPDFVSLRDLAWDQLPYVCVKDEDGNRWFANVTVPTGRVQMNNRQLYLADINVVEVTATAAVTVI